MDRVTVATVGVEAMAAVAAGEQEAGEAAVPMEVQPPPLAAPVPMPPEGHGGLGAAGGGVPPPPPPAADTGEEDGQLVLPRAFAVCLASGREVRLARHRAGAGIQDIMFLFIWFK